MKRFLQISLGTASLLFLAPSVYARSYYWNYVQRGNATALTSISGVQSKFQGSYPSASIRAYQCGTVTEVAVYSSSSSTTPTAQPFSASQTGFYSFWTDTSCIKLQFSGGGLPSTVTIDNIQIALGSVCDLVAFGGDSTGSAAADTALSNAITACNSTTPHGTIHIPRGTFKIATGNISLNGLDKLKITGEGIGISTVNLTHASNDLFTWTSGNLRDIEISDITFTSTSVTRTGGWIFRGQVDYDAGIDLQNSYFRRIEVRKQVNGIWVSKYDVDAIEDSILWDFVGTGGIAIKLGQTAATDINQGAEFRIINTVIWGPGVLSNGAATSLLDYGVWIEDADAVYFVGSIVQDVLQNAVHIAAGAAGAESFFFTNFVASVTKSSHLISVTGTGLSGRLHFDSTSRIEGAGWPSGGGASTSAHGIHYAATGTVTEPAIGIVGTSIRLCSGSGIYISTTGSNDAVINGAVFEQNGFGATSNDNHDIYVNVGTNQVGPTITNCHSTGSNGVNLRTSATSNYVVVTNFTNVFPSGVAYGITPFANGHVIYPYFPVAIDGVFEELHTTTGNAGGVGEQTMWSRTIKGYTLSADGQSLRICIRGTHPSNANAKTWRVHYGSTTIQLNTATPNPNGVNFQWCGILRRKSVTTQSRFSEAVFGTAQQGVDWNVSTENLAADMAFSITCEASAANDCLLLDAEIEKVTPQPQP